MGWYKLCKKYKWLDWIDDHIVWYVYDKPKTFFKTIKYWFHCNWNKEHWRLVKCALTSYPWDYYYIYRLLGCQFDKQIKWFSEHQCHENIDTDVLRPLRWAKHCIKTLTDDTNLFDYDFNTHKKTYIGPKLNYNNIHKYIKNQCEFKYDTPIENIIKFYKVFPEEYYMLKCRYILYKILIQYSEKWWD